MRRLLLALAVIVTVSVQGQGDYFNTPEFWSKLKVETKLESSYIKPDTAIVVVSNRATQNDTLRFMSEERDGKQLRYYYVYARNGKWHVLQVRSLDEAIQLIPDRNRNWVVYTEGMGKLFTTDIYRGLSLAGQYGVNVILLDYPSITTTKSLMGNYFFAISNARVAYQDFLPVFAEIKQMKINRKLGTGKLSLFFHSMGNNVLTGIVSNGKLSILNDAVWVDNLIMNAPCVNQAGHADILSKIAFARHLYIHYNPEDKTLKGAHVMSGHRQLGEKVDDPIYKYARYINFHTLVDEGHSNFLSLIGRRSAAPAALRHYSTLLNGDTVQLNNANWYRRTAYKNIGWDILP
ncbi:MAG: alpha/beta hydrolase [Flavipsychrobacter sp.]|jgi:hypothetical protein|nr:alpha/beta hydrolase [Flavipsychrobacter sp.]